MIQDHIILLAGATMTGKNVTRVDLGAAIYEKVKLSRSESSALVDLVLDEIAVVTMPGTPSRAAEGEAIAASLAGSFKSTIILLLSSE